MTKDNQKPLEQQVIQALDAQNAQMSDKTVRAIRAARQEALTARSQRRTQWFTRPVTYSIGVSFVVLFAVVLWPSWQSQSVPSITAMPNVASADVPSEDLALLEDLEFATWLAANENQQIL
ncbi:DUF3619 family protein [Pseudoalteromonas xiamenensis]|uniref:DUF3619 family protein n=1 Tax=Pseudoalteromonas xiamenensis TaxID=882626 RepID=A0A975DEE8_9GAMM|nr:DUF3619 family protein [Pseudoalteromonas xiamenensis]QTH70306.1 DUF3619 family protein [Pseudoalteromonas xiamenensis]